MRLRSNEPAASGRSPVELTSESEVSELTLLSKLLRGGHSEGSATTRDRPRSNAKTSRLHLNSSCSRSFQLVSERLTIQTTSRPAQVLNRENEILESCQKYSSGMQKTISATCSNIVWNQFQKVLKKQISLIFMFY